MHVTPATLHFVAAATTHHHGGPGYLRWVLIGVVAGVALLVWILLRGYGDKQG